MAYGSFKSVEEVATKFDIEASDKATFVEEKSIQVLDVLLSMIENNLKNDTNYVSEFAICETIIRPILCHRSKKRQF